MQIKRDDQIMRIWSRATIHHQKRLISRFLKEKGRKNVQRDLWMAFLAEEFSVPDYLSIHPLHN